ncbi:hypothetical protein QM933_01320 [Streptococcus parasanguinis]|uniref:hypothetical protein n=1 Tax=Streptococcus parasanguinis TaxID=1318 RepID=UPI0039C31DAF
MKLSIVIEYNVKNVNDKELNKNIKFEYYKRVYKENGETKEQIYADDVKFERNKISIECKRTKSIDLNNCWKTKKSNFKRCIVSSLFYVYNFYKQPIEIKSIVISDDIKGEIAIPFVQEFGTPLPDSFVIDENIEYLFKMISNKEVSDVIYRVLHSQVLYTENKDFYNAYRSFNTMYTFYYTFHNKLRQKGDDNTVDKVAIVSLLRLKNIESSLTNSISLSEAFFVNNTDELYKLIIVWLISENVEKHQLNGRICDQDFKYTNINVLELIKRILESYYLVTDNYNSVLDNFNKRYKKKNESCKINYLQLIAVYAQYRRNKLLHGQHVDSTFLIPDVNADILSLISEIIFQFSIDLVNNIDKNDFSEAKIF